MTYSTSKIDVIGDLTFGQNADLVHYGNINGRVMAAYDANAMRFPPPIRHLPSNKHTWHGKQN